MKRLTYKIEGYTHTRDPITNKTEQRLSLAEVIIENPTDEDIERGKQNAFDGQCSVEDIDDLDVGVI